MLAMAAMAAMLGCSADRGVDPRVAPPVITLPVATANPYNALSAVVTFRAEGVDSARVVYESTADAAGATPYVPIHGGEGRITVLGLRAATSYSMLVEALGGRTIAGSERISAITGDLPDAIRNLRLAGDGTPTRGYTLVVPIAAPSDPDAYVVAFDTAGDIRWYRAFTAEPWAIEAKQQPNGNITVYLGRSYGWQPDAGRFVEVRPSGEMVRQFTVSAAYYTDPHELLLTYRDTTLTAAHLFGYEIRPYDLRSIGGRSDAMLGVHTIERQTASGVTVFRWNAAEHFGPEHWPTPSATAFDLVHPSSLEIDPDGHYVASFQAMDEITKIDSQTGEVLWRFGGLRNQFIIENDTRGGFQGQHSVRVLDNGHLLLFDNQRHGRPPNSRAVEYVLDTRTMVAGLVWEYAPDPPIASPIMGSVQRLAGGNTVVGFGAAGRVAEVNPARSPIWEAVLTAGAGTAAVPFYRAVRMASLYRYERP
jgi:hypothetical protein